MKIVKKPSDKSEQRKQISLDLKTSTLAKVDRAAKGAELSRRALIEEILLQALDDPNFVLRVK